MIRCEQPPNHAKAHLEIGLECAGHEIALLGEERGRQTLPDGSAIIRLRFLEQQVPELARLTRALFASSTHRGVRLRGYELVPGESTVSPAAVACSMSSPS